MRNHDCDDVSRQRVVTGKSPMATDDLEAAPIFSMASFRVEPASWPQRSSAGP
jgi:hypothetical protein